MICTGTRPILPPVIVTHELSQNRGRKRSSDTPENPYKAGELRDLPITYVRTSGVSQWLPPIDMSPVVAIAAFAALERPESTQTKAPVLSVDSRATAENRFPVLWM